MAGLNLSPGLLLAFEPLLGNFWVEAVTDHAIHEPVASLLLPVIVIALIPAFLFYPAVSCIVALFPAVALFINSD